jgi:hypothetical protein
MKIWLEEFGLEADPSSTKPQIRVHRFPSSDEVKVP